MKVEIARQYMEKHVKDLVHALQVEKLSLQLFDQLQELHRCGEPERQFLQCAAYLHEIGCAVCYAKHHKHSLRIILDSHLPSFTPREKQIIANIARYHRKSHPKMKHKNFVLLAQVDQIIVKRMSALLRIADALDCSHTAKIQEIQCKIKKNKCIGSLYPVGDYLEEEAGINKKNNLFKKVFGLNFKIINGKVDEIVSDEISTPEIIPTDLEYQTVT